jgi:hypothetical protein
LATVRAPQGAPDDRPVREELCRPMRIHVGVRASADVDGQQCMDQRRRSGTGTSVPRARRYEHTMVAVPGPWIRIVRRSAVLMSDDVLKALEELATIVLPSLIDDSRYAGLPLHLRTAFHVQPLPDQRRDRARDRVLHAIRDDEPLAALLGKDGKGSFVMFDLGNGSRLDVKSIPMVLVQSAYEYASAGTRPVMTEEDMSIALADCLPRIRRLIRGQADEAVVRAGFQDVALTPDARLGTPWGTLRAATPQEQRFQPFGSAIAASVLQRTARARMRVGEPPTPDPFLDAAPVEELLAQPEQLALAMVLALGHGRRPAFLWQTIATPLSRGTGFSARGFVPQTIPSHPGRALTAGEQAEVLAWSQRVS